MLDSVANDFFAGHMDSAAKTPPSRRVLMEIAQCLANALTTPLGDEELPEAIRQALGIVATVAKAILALVVPIPEYMGSSAKDVIAITNAKAGKGFDPQNALYVLMRERLTDNGFWKSLATEVNLKSGTNKELAPVLKKHCESLKAVKNGDFNDMLAAVLECLKDMPRLESNLRNNATQQLRTQLRLLVQKLGKTTLATDIATLPISELQLLVQSLACVLDDQGIREMHCKLEAWMQASEGQFAEAECERWLAEALEEAAVMSFEKLAYHVNKYKQGFPDKVLEDVLKLIPRMLETFIAQASLTHM